VVPNYLVGRTLKRVRILRGTVLLAVWLVAIFFAVCLIAVIVLELPGGWFQDGDVGQSIRNGSLYLGVAVVAGGLAWKLWPRPVEPPMNEPGT